MPLSKIFQLISWWSVLLLEETGVSRENHRPVTLTKCFILILKSTCGCR